MLGKKLHSSSGFAFLPFLIVIFIVVVLILIVKGAQQTQETRSQASSFAINCSATCNDGRTYSDSCPGNTGSGGTFPSCSSWASQACGSNGVRSYGGSTGGTCPGNTTPAPTGGGGTSSICSGYYPTASACRNVTVNNLCNGYNYGYYCRKSGTTNSNDNKPNCGCVQSNSTPAPTPTVAPTPAPSCVLNGHNYSVGQCGCGISGYDTKMCSGGNTWITRINICGGQCHPLATPPPIGTSCDSLPGGADDNCTGKKVGDACAGGLKCKALATQGGVQKYYCSCSF